MINVIEAKNKEATLEELPVNLSSYKKVVVEVGAGDGSYSYRLAKQNPEWLVIAVDASKEELRHSVHKAKSKPEKGGLENFLGVVAAAEQLPPPLHAIADSVEILFPWGSLLAGLVVPNLDILKEIRLLCKEGATLRIILTYSSLYEESMMTKYQLPEITDVHLANLKQTYEEAGIEITSIEETDAGALAEKGLLTSWGKRITSQRTRKIYILNAVAR